MRWGYLVPRVVIVSAVWLFFAFAFDPLLRWGTVESSQQMTGAIVDVDGMRTKFFPPSIGIGHVELANQAEPMTNLIEFDSFRFHLEGDALMHRKFVIEEGTLTGLKWGTPRSESGQLPEQAAPDPNAEDTGPGLFDGFGDTAKDLGQDWLAELTNRAETLADPRQFESVRLAESMQDDWTAKFHSYETRIKSLETRVKELEKAIKNAKGSTIERLQEYDKARREVNELLTEADRIRREIPGLGKQANEDYRSIDIARRKDLDELRAKLEGFKLDAETISDALIGPELRARLAETIDWVQWFRNKLAAVQNQPEPERLRGKDVDFSNPNELPQFLVRKLKLTGEADIGGEIVPFKGLINDITSDPVLYGKPMVVQLYGKKTAIIQVKAVIDHTVATPVYDIAVAYSLPQRSEMQLGKQSKVKLNLAAAKTDWLGEFRLQGDQLSGKLNLRQSPVLVTVNVEKETKPEIKRILEQSLTGVNNIEATIALWGPYKKPEWKVKSNLGQQISAGMNHILSRELETKRQELALKVDSLTREKMAEFDMMLNDEFKSLVADLNLSEQNAQQLIQRMADRSGLNIEKLGNKLGLDEKQDELLRKSGLDKQIDLEKFDPKKLFPKKKIDFKKLFD
ncbi:MAG: TIGR03545 family protein [Planctomycetaceae bacterium]|jgi:uncharacterized protein (TIGR03545 family)|nr:TIGR03545 family protein [Planctomycetaceae bacterium]MBT6487296.1 TIGR03545 family protein [Planctomycetaceae bacterium]MBT6493693.1 TIGR03545 family protein [Planctomycetaceae bacterium]